MGRQTRRSASQALVDALSLRAGDEVEIVDAAPGCLARSMAIAFPADYRFDRDAKEASMHVAKWGNSLAVRLPKALVESMGLKAGDEVDLTPLSDGKIGVEKIDRGAEFLARMAEFNVPAPEGYKFDRDEANER